MREPRADNSAPAAPSQPTPSLFPSLFDGSVVVREKRFSTDAPLPNLLEAPLVHGCASKRQAEFLAGRQCAHEALAVLGRDSALIGIGTGGEPVWPDNVIGTITHCDGFAAAAVAPAEQLESLGIDAERWRPLPDGVVDMVSVQGERDAARRHFAFSARPTHWDLLIFCAKEAAYKALFPRARRWIGFEEAEVVFQGRSTFVVTTTSPDLPTRTYGAWKRAGDLVLAAVSSRTGVPTDSVEPTAPQEDALGHRGGETGDVGRPHH